MPTEKELIEDRIRKRQQLLKLGINPYPYGYNPTHSADEIKNRFKKLKPDKFTRNKVRVAGRIVGLRRIGKITFMHIQDQTGKIQAYFQSDTLRSTYDTLKLIDMGDWLGLEGLIFTTKTGEITVLVKSFQLLCKSLRPLPEKWHGLKDIEIRYRKRYLDLIANPEVKEIFIKKAKVVSAIREFLVSKGFLEVETPVLQPVYGGTSARPFKTFMHELKMDTYMRISNELYLKRLVVGGFEKIFEFSKDFRNESIDRTHNPEFTLLETMWAFADYKKNMDLTEEMVEFVVKKVLGTTKATYQGKLIDFKRPWKRMSMVQAIKKHTKIDVEKLSDDQIKTIMRNYNIEYQGDYSRGIAITLIFEELVEDKLIQPTIVYDFPHETCVLAKQKRDNPFYAERFEPIINGWELGNTYTEENRPDVLRREWEKEEKKFIKGTQEAQRMDEDFIYALEIGLPPVSGMSIGVDRLTMLLTDSPSVRDVIFFPFMKQ